MYIYWEELSYGHLRRIPDNEKWELYCEEDDYGNDCLFLKIGDDLYSISDSSEWTSGRPKLHSSTVGEYYNAVVKAVFDSITKDVLSYIDLTQIEGQVLSEFWKKWQEQGYVEMD